MKIVFYLISIFFLATFTQAKTVTMGLYENPPLSYTDISTKKEKGLFVDILKKITEKNDIKLQFTHCSFQECLKLLKEKKIDILGPIAYSQKRAKYILFPNENVISNWGVVYAKNASKIKNFLDLKNKKIGVLKKDIYTGYFMQTVKKFNINLQIVKFNSYSQIFKAIENGEIFAGIGGRLLAYSMYSKFPDIEQSNIIFKPTDITYALNKEDVKLKKFIDENLKSYKIDENSKYYKILNQYLTIKPNIPYLKWIIISISILLLLVFFLVYINKILNNRVKKATKKLSDAKNTIKQNLVNQLYLTSIIETVKDVNQILLEEMKLENKLNSICNKIVENSLYSFCTISHIDKSGLTSVKANSKNKKNLKFNFQNKPINENSLLYTSYKNRKIHTQSIEESKFCIDINKCGFSYFISAPVFVDKKLQYFLSVFTTNPNGFKEKEVGLINELSGDIGLLLTLEKHKRDKEDSYEQIIISLNKAVEARDPYTAGHDERVQAYSRGIAKILDIEQKDIEILEKSALIHDIGKIKIPDAILLKPAKLTEVEYDIVKEHPKAAYDMLKDISFLKNEIEIILHHHERYDGSGYPDGLKGEHIPILSQILSIADTFDAMTTNRIYKQAKNKKLALEELDSLRNIHFSDKIIDAALKYFETVDTHEEIFQMPLNALEEARFSYFFKDNTTDCYNRNFLQYLFIEKKVANFKFLYTINLKNFTSFNQVFGWENGDLFLMKFAKLLKEVFSTDKIFRVKGDDFIVLVKNNQDIQKENILKNNLFENKITDFDIQKINILEIKDIDSIKEIIRKL